MNNVVDHGAQNLVLDEEGYGEPQHIPFTVVCPRCCTATTLAFLCRPPPLEWLLQAMQRDHN